jgi:hypothetical protein
MLQQFELLKQAKGEADSGSTTNKIPKSSSSESANKTFNLKEFKKHYQ